MIDNLEEGIADTRLGINNILRAMRKDPHNIEQLLSIQEWAVEAFEANKVVRMLAIDDDDVDFEDVEQLMIIKHSLTDIYNATHKLLQRIRYD